MPLISILSIEIEPGKMLEYMSTAAELAARAREQNESFVWTAHEAIYGGVSTLHFGSQVDSYGALSQRGLPQDMILRVLGEERGAQALQTFGSSTRSARTSISVDRPDLSYPRDEGAPTAPFAVLTTVKARSGQLEACEELIRKIAEAIPKVGDAARMHTFQTVIGDLSEYWTARPLNDLADLDSHLPGPDLLNQAFGPAEGGLIYRAGLDAIESVERSIVAYREDLSNPPAQ